MLASPLFSFRPFKGIRCSNTESPKKPVEYSRISSTTVPRILDCFGVEAGCVRIEVLEIRSSSDDSGGGVCVCEGGRVVRESFRGIYARRGAHLILNWIE